MNTFSNLSIIAAFFTISSGSLFGQGVIIQEGAAVTIENGARVDGTGSSKLTIQSSNTGVGSLIDYNSSNAIHLGSPSVIERFVEKDLNWHFLSSPVSDAEIWPEFAPTPSGTFPNVTFGPSPWHWDFYYWNPNCQVSNGLPWVNLRNEDGTYNSNQVDAIGNAAGFGSSNNPASFISGRGYLVAYGSSYASTLHRFIGSLHAGNQSIQIIKGNNAWNLLGNPYPSSIDWKSASGWDRSNLVESSSGGYDYWVYVGSAHNFGVFNSISSEDNGTLGTSRYIAPMQAFFVKSSYTGTSTIGLTNQVQRHSNQDWLKNDLSNNEKIQVKLSCNQTTYYDEMIIHIAPEISEGGSQKFWSIDGDSPELYAILDEINYSIFNCNYKSGGNTIPIGIKSALSGTYTLHFKLGTTLPSNVVLEDITTGTTQNLIQNPDFTFQAIEGNNQHRFNLIIGSPNTIQDNQIELNFRIKQHEGTIVIEDNAGRPIHGRVKLIDLLGRTCYQSSIHTTKVQVPFYDKGCFILLIETNSNTFTKKIVVQ